MKRQTLKSVIPSHKPLVPLIPTISSFCKVKQIHVCFILPLPYLHERQHTVYAYYTNQLNPDWRKLFPKYFMRPALSYTKTKDIKRKDKKFNILCEHRYKYFKQNISQPNLQYIKEILHHNQVEFILEIQGWLNI